MTTNTITSAQIISRLPVRQRATLVIRDGLLLDLDPEHGDAIIGSVDQDGEGYYLGCGTCALEIEESDGGMCPGCRRDLAHREADAGYNV